MIGRWFILLCVLLSIMACDSNKSQGDAGRSPFKTNANDNPPHLDLPDIQQNGELIVLTLYGPESYFEFRGEDFGVQFMIARQYAQSIGVSIRVDVSRNQHDLIEKLQKGEDDFIAFQVEQTDSLADILTYVGEKEMYAFMDSLSQQRKDA